MTRHPSDEILFDLAGGGDPLGSTKGHLESGCRRCEGKLREYRLLLAALNSPALAGEPPVHALERATSWLHDELGGHVGEARATTGAEAEGVSKQPSAARAPRPRLNERIASVLRRFEAALVFDSAATPAMAGVRAGSPEGARQLLYRAEMGSLHLEIEVLRSGRRSLTGQFVHAGDSMVKTGRLSIASSGRRIERRLRSNALFRVHSLPAGPAQIEIQWGDQLLVVPPLPE
jgi:hypothetical protein